VGGGGGEREGERGFEGGKRDGFSDWFRKVKVSLSSKTHARFGPAQYEAEHRTGPMYAMIF
jgi:hypothetical protein